MPGFTLIHVNKMGHWPPPNKKTDIYSILLQLVRLFNSVLRFTAKKISTILITGPVGESTSGQWIPP